MNKNIEDFSPQEYFDSIGNDETSWKMTADSLMKSADVLYNKIGKPPKSGGDIKSVWEWLQIYQTGRMLRGMALECLFKALWLHLGGTLVKNGKYHGIPSAKDHDLISLYNHITKKYKFDLTEEELLMLSRFSFAIIEGRYPIQKNIFNSNPSAPVDSDKVKWNKIEYYKDKKIIQSLFRKILSQLKAKSPNNSLKRDTAKSRRAP